MPRNITLTPTLFRKWKGIIPPYPPGALHLPVKRVGERIMSNSLPHREAPQRAVSQSLLPPGEENRGKGLSRERLGSG
jgi:hypothetical protein